MAAWNHPTFGEMTFETYAWSTEFQSEKFRQFTYFGYEWQRAEYVSRIQFEAEDETDIPNDEIVEVGRKVAENHESLIEQALVILLEDFRGTSRESGMWWHGGMDQVVESVADDPKAPDRLETTQDLYHHLGLPSIFVQSSGYGYDAPCAIIGFEASFDPERGVGFLTDGEQILGVGYRGDAGAFPHPQ